MSTRLLLTLQLVEDGKDSFSITIIKHHGDHALLREERTDLGFWLQKVGNHDGGVEEAGGGHGSQSQQAQHSCLGPPTQGRESKLDVVVCAFETSKSAPS